MLSKADRAFKNLHKHLEVLKAGLRDFQRQHAPPPPAAAAAMAAQRRAVR
jgi:hypothetical protein